MHRITDPPRHVDLNRDSIADAFSFEGARCDHIVADVMTKLHREPERR